MSAAAVIPADHRAVGGRELVGAGAEHVAEPPAERDEEHPLAAALDEATRGPVPLVRPPRDPEQLTR